MSEAESLTPQEKLLRNWDHIYDIVCLARGDDSPRERWWGAHVLQSPLPDETQAEIARRWVSIFMDEIETVRLVRNALAHGQQIDAESLSEALRLSDEMLTILNRGLVDRGFRPAAAG